MKKKNQSVPQKKMLEARGLIANYIRCFFGFQLTRVFYIAQFIIQNVYVSCLIPLLMCRLRRFAVSVNMLRPPLISTLGNLLHKLLI